MDRRLFLRSAVYATSALCTAGLYRYWRGGVNFLSSSQEKEILLASPSEKEISLSQGPVAEITPEPIYKQRHKVLDKSIYDFSNATEIKEKEITDYKNITTYNNFYEFSTDKQVVAEASSRWKINDWDLEISGLVENPLKLKLSDIQKIEVEERVYRFRCVEGWAMVIPWMGFPLARLLEKARPTSKAKYVAFESYFDEKEMPSAKFAGIPFPYVEGLRLDEALHPLTLMATGLYKKSLANQNGAPIRLVVPWKYGFKSVKSIIKIKLVESEPVTTWNLANPQEYGFYSNVNPNVDHPRWSQKKERRIGEFGLTETLLFNGYEKQVAHLYKDMDLRKYF